jgi:transposase-like protein
MLHRCRKTRNPLFAKRGFSDEIINLSVRQYLRFKLSYRDLAQIMGELGASVAPYTILRWVIRYSVEFAELWRQFEKTVGRRGVVTRPISRWVASGRTYTAPSTSGPHRGILSQPPSGCECG